LEHNSAPKTAGEYLFNFADSKQSQIRQEAPKQYQQFSNRQTSQENPALKPHGSSDEHAQGAAAKRQCGEKQCVARVSHMPGPHLFREYFIRSSDIDQCDKVLKKIEAKKIDFYDRTTILLNPDGYVKAERLRREMSSNALHHQSRIWETFCPQVFITFEWFSIYSLIL